MIYCIFIPPLVQMTKHSVINIEFVYKNSRTKRRLRKFFKKYTYSPKRKTCYK